MSGRNYITAEVEVLLHDDEMEDEEEMLINIVRQINEGNYTIEDYEY